MTLINGSVYNLSLLQRKRFQTRSSLFHGEDYKNVRTTYTNIGLSYYLGKMIIIALIKRR